MTEDTCPPTARVNWPPSRLELEDELPQLRQRPRTDWTAEDWQAYAEFLEGSGDRLAERARTAERSVLALRARLARGAERDALQAWQDIVRRSGLLSRPAARWRAIREGHVVLIDGVWARTTTKRPGRPADSAAGARAEQAYALRLQQGLRSNLEALALWYSQRGDGAWRAAQDHQALNRMRRLHSAQNKRT